MVEVHVPDEPFQFEDERGAIFSSCGLYRYVLWRRWDRPTNLNARILLFCMLNPSTADANKNDPTIERCQRRAKMMRYDGVAVLNLFAYRSTDPKALYDLIDPVGPLNGRWFQKAFEWFDVDPVCAWGAHAEAVRLGSSRLFLDACDRFGKKPLCLGRTMWGHPKHPLYVPYSAPLISF